MGLGSDVCWVCHFTSLQPCDADGWQLRTLRLCVPEVSPLGSGLIKTRTKVHSKAIAVNQEAIKSPRNCLGDSIHELSLQGELDLDMQRGKGREFWARGAVNTIRKPEKRNRMRTWNSACWL